MGIMENNQKLVYKYYKYYFRCFLFVLKYLYKSIFGTKVKMKNERLTMNREDWERLREYRKAPYRKRHLELGKLEELCSLKNE